MLGTNFLSSVLICNQHLVGIAVICSDNQQSAHCINGTHNFIQCCIGRLNCMNYSLKIPCMSHHICICEIYQTVLIFSRIDEFHGFFTNFHSLHSRLICKRRNFIRGNQVVILHRGVQWFTITSIVEKSYMRKFLCFCQSELLESQFQNSLAEWFIHLGSSNQKIRWNFIILIVLCHAGKHYVWTNGTFKMRKILYQHSL